jgi:hypothetical protein
MPWTQPDPRTGWSRIVPSQERDPEPGTEQVAHLQTERARQRLASGESMTSEDRHAQGVRRLLATIGRERSPGPA